MKKPYIVMAIVSAIFLSGCFAPRIPQPYTYRVLVPPTDAEGKKCAMECEKIQLMKKQLSETKCASESENRNTIYDAQNARNQRDFENSITDIEYDSCVAGCGGTYETRNGMR
jgi:outer membrane lipoprotein SlyB